MNQREFWATKPATAVFETITFSHPDIGGDIRLLANQYTALTLGGQVYTPATMQVQIPGQGKDPTPRLQLSFPRIVAGRQFIQAINRISDSGKFIPIGVTYRQWVDGLNTITVLLYVNDEDGISMDAEQITVTATDDNPMRRNVSEIYDVTVFTGLEQL